MKGTLRRWNAGVFLVMAGCMVAALLLGATGASAAFSQSDLTGTWYLLEKADSPTANGPFWTAVTVAVDGNGTITGGNYQNSAGDTGLITGGSLTIDAAGLVNGSATADEGSVTFPTGKLDPERSILGLAVTESGGDVGLMIGIKGGGTFATSDLAGTWYLIEHGSDTTSPDTWWSFVTITVNAAGQVTGGSGVDNGGEGFTVTGGQLFIDSSTGVVFGSATSNAGTATFPVGKLSASKTILGLAAGEIGGENAGIIMGIKGGGSFATADLAGTWYLIEHGDDPTENGPFWSAATITVDNTGKIIGGNGRNDDGREFTVTGGTLSVDGTGVISGSATGSEGGETGTLTFSYGKLDSTKNILMLTVTESGGAVGLMVGIKGSAGNAAKVGAFRPSEGTFYLDYNGNGVWDGCGTDRCLSIGQNGDVALVGDWNGTATDKVGAFRPSDGTFYLDYNGNGQWDGCGVDRCLQIGMNGDIPLVGDWNDGGSDKVGAFRPSDGTFYLDYNGNGAWDGCGVDRCLQIGMNGDTPLVGDWNGDGTDKVGAFRPSDGTFYLDYNGNGQWDGCGADRCLQIGMLNDIPLVGDWNNGGAEKVGVFRPSDGTFYLDYNGNGQWDGCGTDRCLQIGMNGDVALVGDWDGTGSDKVGVFRPSDGTFYLDKNGNGVWEGCGVDACTPIGLASDTPLVGEW